MPVALFVEAVCVLLFVGIALLSKGKQATHYEMVVAGLGLAYVLLYASAFTSDRLRSLPALGGSDLTAMLLSAAAGYAAFFSMLHEGRKRVAAPLLYFGAAIAAAAGVQLFNVLGLPAAEPGAIPGHFAPLQRRMLTAFVDLAVAAAFLSLIAAAPGLLRAGSVRNARWFRYRVASFGCYLAGVLVLLASDLALSEDLRLAGYAISGFCAILFSLAVTTIGYSGDKLTPPRAKPTRPEWDGEASALSCRLERLMREKAPYRDSQLTLESLATLLGVEPRQLSYHFHSHLATSFPNYVNEWRLRSVCLDIRRRPDEPILDIALDNGFNSKSNFNALFVRAYGKTPRQFRNEG